MAEIPDHRAIGEQEAPESASLERWKAQQDIALRRTMAEQDLALRREELQMKQRDASKALWSSPLLLAVIGLIATVLASIVQNFLQSRATRDLERQRFETTLIQKAVETDNPEVAADRLRFLLDLGLIHDESGKIATYVKNPATIPLQPLDSSVGDEYRGQSRKAAKLSIGTKPVESHSDLRALIATLPALATMPKTLDSADAARTEQEQRNIRVPAFLHAASHEASNDFNLIVCDAAERPRQCLIAVVSGLPDTKSAGYNTLRSSREAYKQWFAENVPGTAYDFYQPPIPIEIEGSLLYDTLYAGGLRPGPRSLRDKLTVPWRIRPVTNVVFEKQSLDK